MKKILSAFLIFAILCCGAAAFADGGPGAPYHAHTPPVVTVSCFDSSGNWIYGYNVTVTSSRYIDPPVISGYNSISNSESISVVNGRCYPSAVSFYYEPARAIPVSEGSDNLAYRDHPNPQNDPGNGQSGVVYPREWDTQFRPGLALKEHNLRRYERLYNVNDDNYSTVFEWLIYRSERTDNIPELTAFFDGKTISKVGIRNGYLLNSTDYYRYARAREMDLTIWDLDGNSYTERINIPDFYTTDYHVFQLSRAYSNVGKIEFWLRSFNYDENEDNGHKYIIFISDIQFYQ